MKILRFINVTECTTPKEDHPVEQSQQTEPSRFALAEVLSVEKGNFEAKRVMLCGDDSWWARFALGETGLVLGTPSQNRDGNWRVVISETRRARAERLRTEGAYCIWVLCFSLD